MITIRGRAPVALGVLVAAAVAAGGAYAATEGDRTEDVKGAIEGGQAKNVILLIGDGMAESAADRRHRHLYHRGAGAGVGGRG